MRAGVANGSTLFSWFPVGLETRKEIFGVIIDRKDSGRGGVVFHVRVPVLVPIVGLNLQFAIPKPPRTLHSGLKNIVVTKKTASMSLPSLNNCCPY